MIIKYVGILILSLSVLSLKTQAAKLPDTNLTDKTSIVVNGVERKILTSEVGLALYIFDVDTASQSNCDGVCAEKWPPVLVSSAEESLLSAPFGVAIRKSGLKQLTLDGMPLYTFYLDRKKADILGDGLGGVWHIVETE